MSTCARSKLPSRLSMRAALASSMMAKFFVNPQPSCPVTPAPDSVDDVRSSDRMLDPLSDSPRISFDVFVRGAAGGIASGGRGAGTAATRAGGATCFAESTGAAALFAGTTGVNGSLIGFSTATCFSWAGRLAGGDATGALATTVGTVATLSDDAFELVSCTSSVREGLTTTRTDHAYDLPPTGCAAFARSVYVPTRSGIATRPSRSVSADTESGRSARRITTLSSGNGFTV